MGMGLIARCPQWFRCYRVSITAETVDEVVVFLILSDYFKTTSAHFQKLYLNLTSSWKFLNRYMKIIRTS